MVWIYKGYRFHWCCKPRFILFADIIYLLSKIALFDLFRKRIRWENDISVALNIFWEGRYIKFKFIDSWRFCLGFLLFVYSCLRCPCIIRLCFVSGFLSERMSITLYIWYQPLVLFRLYYFNVIHHFYGIALLHFIYYFYGVVPHCKETRTWFCVLYCVRVCRKTHNHLLIRVWILY